LTGFVVPSVATTMSAFGTGNSDLGFTSERPTYARIAPGAAPTAAQFKLISDAAADALIEVSRNLKLAAAIGAINTSLLLSLRYRGQIHSMDIALEGEILDQKAYAGLLQAFETQYEALFGRGAAFSSAGIEIISVRAVGSAGLPPAARVAEGSPIKRVGTRSVVFRDVSRPLETVIYATNYPKEGAIRRSSNIPDRA
jgi:N-methylhydantoinase A